MAEDLERAELLSENLQAFTAWARSSLPGRSECSVIVRTDDGSRRVASSDARSARCDDAEIVDDDGPCMDALRWFAVTLVPDVEAEPRWAAWTRAARENGFLAAAAFPVYVREGASAAFNVYNETANPWDRDALLRCDLYADQLARVIDLCLDVEDLQRTREHLESAVAAQAAIDRAIGALMATRGCDATTALQILRSGARDDGVDLPEVAHQVLAHLSRRSDHRPDR